MRETSNYKLSQWDKTDRIQMEDFNADNSKVDAALAAEKQARESADAAQASALRGELAAEPDRKEPYILCYFISDPGEVGQRARELHERTGRGGTGTPAGGAADHPGLPRGHQRRGRGV